MKNPPIHPNDDMFTGSVEHYEECGIQLAGFASTAVDLSGCASPTILELPCGYGRVTRHLVKRFPATSVTVADIMKPAVDFTASTFGVHGIVVSEPANEFLNIEDGTFDVAVMGSLITHLSESNTLTVLKHFLAKLDTNGIAVVTSHGARAHEMLVSNTWFEISDADRSTLLSTYESGAHGFVNYDANHRFEKKTVDYVGRSYGVSLIPDSWMRSALDQLGYTIRKHVPAGWDNHQDVYFITQA